MDTAQNAIEVTCTAPFLVRQYIAAKFSFTTLNQIDIRQHAISLESLGELITDCGGTVQAGEGDELKYKSANVSVELVITHHV